MRRLRWVLALSLLLFLPQCLDTTLTEIDWSAIQDAPVPAWLQSWALSKARSTNQEGCDELQERIVREENINDPKQAVDYLRSNFQYISENFDKWYDLKQFIERGGGDCEDWQIAVQRLWKALGLESYVVFTFNGDSIYGHAFVVYAQDGLLWCQTPYYFEPQPYETLRSVVERINKIYKYEPGPYISIPIEIIGKAE